MSNPLFSLDGQVALITGTTRGIGLAIAREYGRAGARLALSSESAEDCRQVVATLAEEGIEACALPADLSQQAEVEALAHGVVQRFGRIDTLVCNAGVAPHQGPLASASAADWELTMTVNLRSALWLTSALLPTMAVQGGGSAVLMASIAGVRGNKGLGLYGLSKAGLAQLARNLAVEWGAAQCADQCHQPRGDCHRVRSPANRQPRCHAQAPGADPAAPRRCASRGRRPGPAAGCAWRGIYYRTEPDRRRWHHYR